MVREVKFSCDRSDRQTDEGFAALTRRASVLDDDRGPRERLRRPKRRKAAKSETAPDAAAVPAVAVSAPATRPATPRRHLAGADWPTDYAAFVRKPVRKAK